VVPRRCLAEIASIVSAVQQESVPELQPAMFQKAAPPDRFSCRGLVAGRPVAAQSIRKQDAFQLLAMWLKKC
jgi:hypothetical protein